MKEVKVFVPATIGNIGPGFDVLGLALDALGDEITLSLHQGPSEILSVTGRDAELIPTNPESNVIVRSALAYLKLKKYDPSTGVLVSVARQLPVSGGLGSSAAAAVGGALAAAHALGHAFSDEDILEAALEGEAMVAGRHLDNIAPCYFGGVTLVQRVTPPLVQKLPVDSNSKFVIVVVSPKFQLNTKDARSVLPTSLLTGQWTAQMAMSIGLAVGLCSENSQLVRDSLHDLFAEPARRALIPQFDCVKQAALASGALGCSMSGSGPSVFALFDNEQMAQRGGREMVKAFAPLAADAIVTKISKTGARRV